MNYLMRAKMYLESLVSQENQNLESNAATEKNTRNESIPIGISSMQSGMDVIFGPTSHGNEQIPIVNVGQNNSTPPLNNENNSVNEMYKFQISLVVPVLQVTSVVLRWRSQNCQSLLET